jgi:structural maintenance of chromosome 2
VIGGKNKYMINGRTVQPSDIKDMFHSVQLNVNNPHFLIMQGRITKVLNMKPVEILSMIEEAAGTRMFQTKKEAALKTIEKKQQKVDELSKCMDDKIGPEMEGLRDKLQQYTVFTSNATEHARLERFCIASNYKDLQENITKYETGKQVICDELHKNEAVKTDKKIEAEECGRRIEAINAVLKEGMKEEFLALKQNEEDLGKALVKVKTLLKNQTETMLSEKEVAVSLESQVLAAKDGVVSKEAELISIEKEVSVKEGEVAVAEKDSIQMRDKHQNALAGVADENSAEVLSLPEQVALLEKRAREAFSSLQQGAQKTEYTKSKLKDLRLSAKNQSSAHAVEVKEAEILKAAITAFELKAKDGSYNAKEEEALRMRVSQLQTSTSNLKDEVDRLTTQLEARLNFDFKDPERGFDRSKVKGLVARLVKVTNSLNATALEVAAGTKLYQVVVDNEQTGKLLLQKGGLRNRVTILPLNRISSKCTDAARVTHAKEIAAAKGATANLALELVGFEEEVRKAMEYTFGNVIICDNSEVAKEIAFDKKVRNRTVTLEGDSFDPSGVMTGGSLNQIGSLLSKITDLASATSALELQMKELQVAESALQRMEAKGAGTRAAERDLDLKKHALRMCTDKLADSSYTQTVNDVTAMEVSLVTLEQVPILHLFLFFFLLTSFILTYLILP